jgi:hypothetical protein
MPDIETKAPFRDDISFEDVTADNHAFAAAERERLRAYLQASQPELVEAYAREEAAFARLSDTVLAPTLGRIAEGAQARGWHTRVVRDSATDGITGVATPGIRLLASRSPLLDSAADAPSGSVSFIGFHGRCPAHQVEMTTVVHPADRMASEESDSRVLGYDALTAESVEGLVVGFLKKLG